MLKYVPIVIAAVFVSTEGFAVQDCEKKAPKFDGSVIRHGCGPGTGPWAVVPRSSQEELISTFIKGYVDGSKDLAKQEVGAGKGGRSLVKY
jgi:hypothetical protein